MIYQCTFFVTSKVGRSSGASWKEFGNACSKKWGCLKQHVCNRPIYFVLPFHTCDLPEDLCALPGLGLHFLVSRTPLVEACTLDEVACLRFQLRNLASSAMASKHPQCFRLRWVCSWEWTWRRPIEDFHGIKDLFRVGDFHRLRLFLMICLLNLFVHIPGSLDSTTVFWYKRVFKMARVKGKWYLRAIFAL